MESNKPKRPAAPAVDRVRKYIILADDIVHIIVALFLVLAALLMLGYAARNFADISVSSILLVINDVLFVLIIVEVLWTIIRYLRREQFSLAPFLFIGIISSVRRLLYIDAQMSLGTSERSFNENAIELGIHTCIVFFMVVAYYLIKRGRVLDD
ncbi:MAG: phosphate-starvation-inducible PsiE family protein [Thermoleophilia bacterium]